MPLIEATRLKERAIWQPIQKYVLSAQLEQTTNLLQDTGRAPMQVIVDLGYRGVDDTTIGVD